MSRPGWMSFCGILLGILVCLGAGCSSQGKPGATDAPPSDSSLAAMTSSEQSPQTAGSGDTKVGEDELSYRTTPLNTESGTPGASFPDTDPGDGQKYARAFENAPPLIPHSLEGLVPITLAENACLECHLPDLAADMGATAIPASHFFDMRKDETRDSLNGANYNCTLCHAAQADVGDLVNNVFTPEFRSAESETSSSLMETLNEGVE